MSKIHVRKQIPQYPPPVSLGDKPPLTRALLQHIKGSGSLKFVPFDRQYRPLWRPYQIDFGSMDVPGHVEMIGGMYAELLLRVEEQPGTLVLAPNVDPRILAHIGGSGQRLPYAQLRELPEDCYEVTLPAASKRPVILLLYDMHSGFDAIGMAEALYQSELGALPTDILTLFDGQERPDKRHRTVRLEKFPWVKHDIRIHSVATVENLYAICSSDRQEFDIRRFLNDDNDVLDRRFRSDNQFSDFLLHRVEQRHAKSMLESNGN